jgi:hypothetical protein
VIARIVATFFTARGRHSKPVAPLWQIGTDGKDQLGIVHQGGEDR